LSINYLQFCRSKLIFKSVIPKQKGIPADAFRCKKGASL